MRFATPGVVAAEEAAAAWTLDLLGLPSTADVGFVTGGTMANWTGLVAGRQHVLAKAGWDVNSQGLTGAPPVRVLVGADRHIAIDVPLRYLGLGTPTLVADDDQGRVKLDALAEALEAGDGPTIVCLAAATCTRGRSRRSVKRRRSRTSTAPGSTSTGPSGCGPAPRPGCGTWSRATRPATPGRRTRTRP